MRFRQIFKNLDRATTSCLFFRMPSHTNPPYLTYSRFNQKVLQIHQKKKKAQTLPHIQLWILFHARLFSWKHCTPASLNYSLELPMAFVLYCFTVKLRALHLGFYSGVMNSNNCVGVSRKSVFLMCCEQAHNGTLFAPN